MPADQRGAIYPVRGGYGIRWREPDTAGNVVRRRHCPRPPFQTKRDARRWWKAEVGPRLETGRPLEPLTLQEFADRYVKWYSTAISRRTGQTIAPVTVETLELRLVRPLAEFGDTKLTELRTGELAAWEATLPPRFRYSVVRALRQVLDAAVAWEYLERNPAKATGRNPAPEVVERSVLEPSEVDVIAGEVRSPYDVAVIVGAWCYLRPGELLALERGDVDGNVLHVRRTLDGAGGTKASAKTRRSLRTVPLPARAREALAGLPPRLDTRLLFPGPSGAPYDLRNFRRREWAAAALDDGVTPYTLRHSGISWALAAGIPPSDVARFAGTSVTMLERVYAHLLTTSSDDARERLDAFSARLGQERATK